MRHHLVLGSCLGLLLSTATGLYGEDLYNPKTFKSLTGDSKAFRVGDLITVQVYENSSASTSTDTSTQRTNSMNAGLSVTPSGKQWGGTLGVNGSFDGGGTTQRANRLLATLSVTVREILPNGELKLAGEQLLTVNGEKHKVFLEGRARAQDISSENTVLSTRLADAKINYVGDGDLTARQKRGWWRRLMDGLGF
ncbi:flagellar basal body L-ring protein FlgH [Holophaga foetida]|uniref:flagellar basal body L-ring protein FlgH n=1 Tax=Holophaga foetida TaxID=35839 RepID=UPI0002474648|nr:flagellar basal body L-ring protein FlgH [Holophaga foetida]